MRIDEAASGQVRVENLSLKNPIRLADNSTIMPGASRELGLPLRLTVGETLIDIEPTLADPVRRESLETIAQPPRIRPRTEPAQSLLNLGGSPTPETLAHWFETVISVHAPPPARPNSTIRPPEPWSIWSASIAVWSCCTRATIGKCRPGA